MPMHGGDEPGIVTELGGAAAAGLLSGGVLPVVKHIPGHGRAGADSHQALPRVAASLEDLRQRDFVDAVRKAIGEDANSHGIDLEITESLIMEDIRASTEKLQEVRLLGANIAIDDFGTGYSSLAYLARLPVQALKIDRSFIITMLGDPAIMTLVSTVISLAHSLRLKVVAEGVDSEEQARELRRLGCDHMQGYLFSKPLPFDKMTALLGPQTGKGKSRRKS